MAYLRTYPQAVRLGPRPFSAFLALVLAFPAAARGPAADFDGRAGAAALHPGFPAPFIPSPAAPRLLPAAAAVPTVRFKGLTLPAVQFSRASRIPATIVAALDRTERTALLALYELKLPAAADAIIRAKRRGVDVRLVFDHGHAGVPRAEPGAEAGRSPDLQRVLDAGVEVRVLKGRSSYGIMHHKTAVLDGELLVAGSFNWTTAADERNFENLHLSDDAGVVALFDADWRWMWKAAKPLAAAMEDDDDGALEAAAAANPPPADPTRPVSFNGGAYPRAAFSPGGGVEPLLIDAIGRARRTIDVAIFSFYSKPVAQALVDAKARGVRVRVAADVGQARRSEAVRLLRAGRVDLRLSDGRSKGFSVMHHKYMVLDEAFFIGGSYNYSINAEQNNHENVLFSTDPGEVAAFLGEQAFVFGQSAVPTDADLPPLQ